MNLETKITIYKFTPQLFTLTPHNGSSEMYGNFLSIKTFLRLRAFLLYTYLIMRAPHGIPVGPCPGVIRQDECGSP